MLSQQIYESLAARLERATTYQQTELVLRAIGNAGNDAALPKIERFLANPNPKLRAIAVAALRRLEDPAVKILLAEVEKNDPDETVQDALRGVLLMRERT
jgi:HEAT repeat protein